MTSDANIDSVFPTDCHFKIICENKDDMLIRVDGALKQMGIDQRVRSGNLSEGGKYITYNVTIHVQDRGTLTHIDETFRGIDGVRMVL